MSDLPNEKVEMEFKDSESQVKRKSLKKPQLLIEPDRRMSLPIGFEDSIVANSHFDLGEDHKSDDPPLSVSRS